MKKRLESVITSVVKILIEAIFINDETLIYDNSETKPNLIFQIADKKITKISEKNTQLVQSAL
ncbi:hypothetical protein A6B41_08800 [Mannheimia granulomatis]|nr:hypothetical protein A6B41_08800 [Mannheimia granulomatis]